MLGIKEVVFDKPIETWSAQLFPIELGLTKTNKRNTSTGSWQTIFYTASSHMAVWNHSLRIIFLLSQVRNHKNRKLLNFNKTTYFSTQKVSSFRGRQAKQRTRDGNYQDKDGQLCMVPDPKTNKYES